MDVAYPLICSALPPLWIDSAGGTNQTYNETLINQLGSCQQTTTYEWGFSLLMLYIFLISLLVWMIGTYYLWVYSELTLKAHQKIEFEAIGEYQAIMTMSKALQENLSEDGKDW